MIITITLAILIASYSAAGLAWSRAGKRDPE